MPIYNDAHLNGHQRYKIASLKRSLQHAENYNEWKTIAQQLDEVTGLEAWKFDNTSPHYGYSFLAQRLIRIKRLIEADQQLDLAEYLR